MQARRCLELSCERSLKSTSFNRLQFKSLKVMTDVIIDEGGNEIVRVIITRLHSQEEWNFNFPACLVKLVW